MSLVTTLPSKFVLRDIRCPITFVNRSLKVSKAMLPMLLRFEKDEHNGYHALEGMLPWPPQNSWKDVSKASKAYLQLAAFGGQT